MALLGSMVQKGIVGRFGVLFFGQRIKRGAFAHVWQADNSDAKRHVILSVELAVLNWQC